MGMKTWHLSKIVWMRATNLLLYLGFCFLAGTGLLLIFRLPPHSRQATVFGLTRHEWGDWHQWAAYLVMALIVLHLVQNRAWLQKVAAQKHAWRWVAGLGVGLGLVAGIPLLP
ncbi:MAG: hypothetical protein E1N59_2587 [Puniceicoccaceae bacterium 5H]|nr:MAG: hypothetical protein E1N59_2587 [Puniceicoccaceae bacterium 5H]